jgi:hypothetical protein
MKTLLKKIDLINSMIESVELSENIPLTYSGGTFPRYVVIKPIKVKNQFVTIEANIKSYSFIDGKERYNINKASLMADEYCKKHLNYTLNIILKSFKNSLK